jgi:hypothetical protein
MKTLYILFLSLTGFFGLLSSSLMSSPGMPNPYFHVPDANKTLCLEVIPFYTDSGDGTGSPTNVTPLVDTPPQARVRCLSLGLEDKIEQRVLWKTEILFPSDVYLSNCAKFMVAYRKPADYLEKKELENWPMVEFYSEGKSIRKKRLIDFDIKTEELERPNFDIGYYHVLHVDIVGITEENYPTHEERKLFEDKYLFKPLDELLYVAAGNRVYYFCLSDGELVYKKINHRR